MKNKRKNIQNLANELSKLGGGSIYLPKGNFEIKEPPSHVSIIGYHEGEIKIKIKKGE